MSLPCNQPCPKCGSDNINRSWIAPGIPVIPPNYKATTGNVVEYTSGKTSTSYDRIRSHCWCCHYEWDRKTLAAEAAGGDDESELSG